MKSSFLLAGLSALVLPALALDINGPRPVLDRSVVREVYQLRAGDRVSVQIQGMPQLAARLAAIDAEGRVALPGLPATVRVVGLSCAEAETLLAGEYRQRASVPEPKVWLGVVSYAPREIAPRWTAPRGELPRATSR